MDKKLMKAEYDERGFREAKELAVTLESLASKKIAVLKQSRDIYLMNWADAPKSKQVKVTISPDGKNKTKRAVQLLTSTSPTWKLPTEKNDPSVEQKSSLLEQMANMMWSRSNHVQELKVERDLALSGFVYDEMILTVICMDDVVTRMKDGVAAASDKWEKARWEARLRKAEMDAKLTPYRFEVMDPLTTFIRYGAEKVAYVKVKRTAGDVRAHWGPKAEAALKGMKDSRDVTECRLYDGACEYVWLKEGSKEPIFADVHGLPFLPVISVRAEGSRLFEDQKAQYDPFLKTLAESGIWELQNRMWTALNTNITATLDAQWVFKKGAQDDRLEADFSQLLGVWNLPPGASLEPLTKDIVSKDVMQMWALIGKTTDDSTIHGQVTGEGAGKNDPYALASLMHQAGRLPLAGVQTMMGELLARTMEVTFQWMRAKNQSSKIQAQYGNELIVEPKDIPDVLEFVCTVDVDLPQDKLQMLNAGKLAVDLGASQEWALSKFANVENPDKMRAAKFKEAAWAMIAPKMMERIMAQLEQRLNPAPAAPPSPRPGPMPPAGNQATVQGGLPPAMKGELPQPPPNMQAPEEMLPPEMMSGGMA